MPGRASASDAGARGRRGHGPFVDRIRARSRRSGSPANRIRANARQSDCYSIPFVDGNASPMRGSGSQAWRMARATALNMPSMT